MEPKLKEINVSFSAGGKVQIIKFDVSSDYHISASERYEIPEEMSNEDARAFRDAKYTEIRALVDAQAQAEFDDRWEQSYLS